MKHKHICLEKWYISTLIKQIKQKKTTNKKIKIDDKNNSIAAVQHRGNTANRESHKHVEQYCREAEWMILSEGRINAAVIDAPTLKHSSLVIDN